MVSSKWVRVGSVRRFDEVKPDKEQALKVLEEAAEVVEAIASEMAADGYDEIVDAVASKLVRSQKFREKVAAALSERGEA